VYHRSETESALALVSVVYKSVIKCNVVHTKASRLLITTKYVDLILITWFHIKCRWRFLVGYFNLVVNK